MAPFQFTAARGLGNRQLVPRQGIAGQPVNDGGFLTGGPGAFKLRQRLGAEEFGHPPEPQDPKLFVSQVQFSHASMLLSRGRDHGSAWAQFPGAANLGKRVGETNDTEDDEQHDITSINKIDGK